MQCLTSWGQSRVGDSAGSREVLLAGESYLKVLSAHIFYTQCFIGFWALVQSGRIIKDLNKFSYK